MPFPTTQRAGGVAGDNRTCSHVFADERARTDDGVDSDLDPRQHDRARADERSFSDGDAAGQHGAWTHMNPLAQRALVVDARSSVDDAPHTESDAWPDNGSREDLAPLADRS
jgi:hypothetical protein